jgi:cytochrome c-type biogenesis protein CcmH
MSRLLALFSFCLCCGAWAATPAHDLDAKVMHVTEQLRCLVCQNESIAESQADLAQDLRRQVREMLAAGKTETQVREYLVDRYGDFVLYDPPFKAATLLLWLGPLLLALASLGLFFRQLHQRNQSPPTIPDEATLARARELLSDRNNTP